MINILDLRLNNLLYYNGDVVYVASLSLDRDEIEVKIFDSKNQEPTRAPLKDVQSLKITESWLLRFGFIVDVWSNIQIGESKTLSLGRTGSPDGLPYHPMLKEDIEQGFSIKEAYEIQVAYNDFSDKGGSL